MATSAPLDNYPTSDGQYVAVVAGSNVNFRRLCAAMGTPELADDPQWSTLQKRAARSDEINDIVEAWTLVADGGRGRGRAASSTRCRWAPRTTRPTMFADPHFEARGDFVTVDDPVAGPHRQQAPFPRLDGARPTAPSPAPTLGQHNDEVWGDVVGLSSAEQDRLRADGVI